MDSFLEREDALGDGREASGMSFRLCRISCSEARRSLELPVVLNENEALPALINGAAVGCALDCDGKNAAVVFMSVLSRLQDDAYCQNALHQAVPLSGRRYSHEGWLAWLQARLNEPELAQ